MAPKVHEMAPKVHEMAPEVHEMALPAPILGRHACLDVPAAAVQSPATEAAVTAVNP